MKKLILSIALTVFAVSVQAGDTKTCSDKQSSCCGGDKATMQTKAEGSECGGCTEMTKSKKATHMAKNQSAGKHALLSPKAAADAVK